MNNEVLGGNRIPTLRLNELTLIITKHLNFIFGLSILIRVIRKSSSCVHAS